MKTALRVMVLLILVHLFSSPTFPSAHGDKRAMKKGILLVAFGTTVPEAQISFDNIERSVKKTFPGIPARWGYTSRTVIRKMAEKGQQLATPAEALSSMMRENFTHVAVQSFHIMPGAEFHGLVKNVQRFADMSKGLKKVMVGYPLMSTSEDVQRVAEALVKIIPQERSKKDAVVFMGHGTYHPANVYYAALNYHLQKLDPNVFVGTLEGWPDIDEIKSDLKKKRIKKAYLMPFMTVAGGHAREDMAGPSEDSWKSIMEKEGINCVVMLKGAAEFQEFVDIWVDHLRSAFERLR